MAYSVDPDQTRSVLFAKAFLPPKLDSLCYKSLVWIETAYILSKHFENPH